MSVVSARILQRSTAKTGTEIIVEFMVDGVQLSRSPFWREAPSLVAEGVAACLRRLTTRNETMLISVCSGREVPHQIGSKKMVSTAEQRLYLLLIAPKKVHRYIWISAELDDLTESNLVLEPRGSSSIQTVVDIGWDWNSFRGCVLSRAKAHTALKKLHRSEKPHKGISTIAEALIWFEDWDDACALRLWSNRLSLKQLQNRIDLEGINRSLKRARTPKRLLFLRGPPRA